jgi:YVTN family beta-propeller protein
MNVEAFATALLLPLAASAGRAVEAPAPAARVQVEEWTHAGVRVHFEIAPASSGDERVEEGRPASLRFQVTDEGGFPLTGLRPAVWMDPRKTDGRPDAKLCENTVQSYLQPSLGAQAMVDLSTYYVLALNDEPSISVLDPIRGFSTSKLLTLVLLQAPGEDWVASREGSRLFVSMPAAGKVAVVSTATWQVLANVEAGPRPSRVALQHDGRYLWVDGGAGSTEVVVIDTADLKQVARISAGAGPHELAFTADDRYALIANRGAGTVSVIDVRSLSRIREVVFGPHPVGVGYSRLSNTFWIAEEDGSILAVDAAGQKVMARLVAEPGLSSLGVTQDGRWVFAINRAKDAVHIVDASRNRLRYTVKVGKSPDQVSFTDAFAYVRSLEAEQLMLISLSQLGKGEQPTVSEIPGGQIAPARAGPTSRAAAVVAAPEPGAALIANPADRLVYYYMEGMAAPMGSFSNYRRSPRAVLVSDRGLRETAPGTYAATVRLPADGSFDVAFLVDSPRVVHCFEATAAPDPVAAAGRRNAGAIVPLFAERTLALGSPLRMRFEARDSATGDVRAGLRDLDVLTVLAPGVWRNEQRAAAREDGSYEVTVQPPKSGIYYVYWQSPSLRLRFEQSRAVVFQVVTGETTR